MVEATSAPRPTDPITTLEGFEAMRLFLEAAWQRQENIAFVIGGARWVDGAPVDPTMWQDWLMAVRAVRIATSPSMAREKRAHQASWLAVARMGAPAELRTWRTGSRVPPFTRPMSK
jgi:hypothetical protein